MGLFEALCGLGVCLFLLYRYLTATYNFWKERNVPGPEPLPLFGTMKDVILSKEFTGTHWKRIYDAYEDAKFVGLFKMREPILMIKDPKYIKDVLIKDGLLFPARGILPPFIHAEPLFNFLFFLDRSVAHPLRAKLSTTFTPSKLREAFSMMRESVMRLENYMDTLLMKGNCVDCGDVSVRLTADIIGTSLMGIDMKTLSTESTQSSEITDRGIFLTLNEVLRSKNKNALFRTLLCEFFPNLYNLIGFHLFNNDKLANFYRKFVDDLMDYRKKYNINKSDFLGVLMQLKDNPKKLTGVSDHFYGAQICGFFNAGHETTAVLILNTLYELALNQNIQDKVRNEIQNFYAHNEELTYDNVNLMTYLNAIVKESLRKYPGADSLLREAITSYTFENTKLTISPGNKVLIPLYAIHHDPKIYPNPEMYDPERFNEEAVRSRDPMYHLPFGYGTRNCFGERLGLLQSKVILISFLRKYKLDVCDKTISTYKYRSIPLSLLPANPIYLKVTKVDCAT